MCLFVQKLDDTENDYHYYCRKCCFEAKKARFVLNCWERGCTANCSAFGPRCINHAEPLESETSDGAVRIRAFNSFYKILQHEPGNCFVCKGSGIASSVTERLCPECEGTGICPGCNGNYMRVANEISPIEQVREW